uniref:NAC transcription factor 25-like n=1 Tax=Nicotiana sylvestris TaxID=4096 RepID=A0A1U7VLN7_NICSY|nr:PREDICTED: NAC transcription factor 25-like [Nicotiana sylvestris]
MVLAGKAMAEGNKWYFYSRATNETRITGNGYWQPVGVDESIMSSSNHKVIGTKKYYAFYMGDEPPQGHKTNWLMQEYRLSHSSASATRSSSRTSTTHSTNGYYSKWVICRVYESNSDNDENDSAELSCLDEVFLSLDDLDDDNISLPH